VFRNVALVYSGARFLLRDISGALLVGVSGAVVSETMWLYALKPLLSLNFLLFDIDTPLSHYRLF
jgi:hypothetical protein